MRLWLDGVSQDVWLRAVGLGLIALVSGFYYTLPAPRPQAAHSVPPAAGQLVAAPVKPPADPPASHYIAHAGGQYGGTVYTNSIAALDHNYAKGFRLIEVDLNLTTDNEVVLLHDWSDTVVNVYGLGRGPRDLATFVAQTQGGRHQVATLAQLADWVARHPQARIVLDTKVQLVDVLSRVAAAYPHLRGQFIPYINALEQYEPVRALGYHDVGLLTHRFQYDGATLLQFAKTHDLHAIAMQPATFTDQLPELTSVTRVYCWTVNNGYVADSLRAKKVYGVVTDSLVPEAPPPAQTAGLLKPRPATWPFAALSGSMKKWR